MPETFPKKEINGIYEIDCKEVDIWEQPLAVVQPFPFLSLPDVLRGRVLEFVLVASEGSTLRLPRGCFPDRVPYSAAASLRTLAFHSRSIKAVCKAVAGDTRLIERRIATPAAWLKALWDRNAGAALECPLCLDAGVQVKVGCGCCFCAKCLGDWRAKTPRGMKTLCPTCRTPVDPVTRHEAVVLEECRERAQVARCANLALEMYNRLDYNVDTARRGNRPDVSLRTPKDWCPARARAVRALFHDEDNQGEGNPEPELAWAHARIRSPEEMRGTGLGPVAREGLTELWDMAFGRFIERFVRKKRWTLIVDCVELQYRGRMDKDGEWLHGTDADYDKAEAALESFFGAETMRADPWIHAWCNKCEHPYPAGVGYSKDCGYSGHDANAPPITRMRDVLDMGGCRVETLELAENFSRYRVGQLPLAAATVEISIAEGASITGQGNISGPYDLSPYYFIDPGVVARCRSGSPKGKKVSFKIATSVGKAKSLDQAIVFVPLVRGVFDATLHCHIAGLS